MMETRWVIERYAIERIIERPGDVAAALAESVAAQADLEIPEFIEADRAFHRTLVAGTNNQILLSLYDSLRDRQRRMAARHRPLRRAPRAQHPRARRTRGRDRRG